MSKAFRKLSGSLGNFYNVSAHLSIFTFILFYFIIFYFYCILFSSYALVKIEKMISALCKCSYSEKSALVKPIYNLVARKALFRAGLSGVGLRNCLALVYLLRAIYRSLPVGIRLDVIRLTSRSSCVSRQHLNIRWPWSYFWCTTMFHSRRADVLFIVCEIMLLSVNLEQLLMQISRNGKRKKSKRSNGGTLKQFGPVF